MPSEYAALIHLGLGEDGRSLDLLETAMAMRSSAMIYLRIDPIVDPLRHLPRFRLLLDGVPEA